MSMHMVYNKEYTEKEMLMVVAEYRHTSILIAYGLSLETLLAHVVVVTSFNTKYTIKHASVE